MTVMFSYVSFLVLQRTSVLVTVVLKALCARFTLIYMLLFRPEQRAQRTVSICPVDVMTSVVFPSEVKNVSIETKTILTRNEHAVKALV